MLVYFLLILIKYDKRAKKWSLRGKVGKKHRVSVISPKSISALKIRPRILYNNEHSAFVANY